MKRIIRLGLQLTLVLLVMAITDQAQNTSWVKSFGGPDDEYSQAMTLDSAGNSYITGIFRGQVDFDPGPNNYNLITQPGVFSVFILKLNPAGDLIWAKQLGGNGDTRAYAISLDASGNVYTAGSFSGAVDFDPGAGTFYLQNFSAGSGGGYISKLDSAGNFLWAVDLPGSIQVMKTDFNGNSYSAGIFQYTGDFDPGPSTYFMTALPPQGASYFLKLNSSGSFVQAKQLDEVISVEALGIDLSCNVYLTGSFSDTIDFDPGPGTKQLSTIGPPDIFVLKMDSTYNFKWVKQFGGKRNDLAHAIALDGWGNIYLAGSINDTAYFGNTLPPLIAQGSTTDNSFISKLDSTGSPLWLRAFIGTGANAVFATSVDKLGYIYTTGYLVGTADFNPGVGSYSMTSAGSNDIFISKLDSGGHFISAFRQGGAGADMGRAIAVSDIGQIFLTGFFQQTVPFNVDNTSTFTAVGGYGDVFVEKLSQFPTGVRGALLPSDMLIYPNPTSGLITVKIRSLSSTRIFVKNSLGQIVYNCKFANNQIPVINLTYMPDGLYFLTVETDRALRAIKVVKHQ